MSFFEQANWKNWAPSCDCEPINARLITKIIADGRPTLVLQCQTCERTGAAISGKMLSEQERQDAARRLVDLAEVRRKENERSQELRRQNDEANVNWWRRNNDYLRSPEWKDRAKRVLERDNYVCQACMTRRAIQAHHLTYRHVFNEPLFDLVAVCVICHDAITELEDDRIPAEVPFVQR